jgi:hypothetical protein
MKKNLQSLICALTIGSASFVNAQSTVTGPSSSQTPYLKPYSPATTTITSILTVTDVIGGYKMCGLADGLGAYDNGNGTFTLLMNHEMGNTVGVTRAHGSIGAFVSKWIINKTTLAVTSGTDLIQNVNIWNGTSYTTYNATTPSTLAAFSRFCSADLPAVSAFSNTTSGLGTPERIFMNGEESGAEGRAFAHIATGTNAGTTYELPRLGKFSWENAVASANSGTKTVVAGMDDNSTNGQVYFYIGTKTNSGTEVDKAGLTNGKLYGVAVTGLLAESSSTIPTAGTTFSLIDLGNVAAITGASLNTMSNNMGVTSFLRPEDGSWNPSNPNDFYFLTTNSFSSPSRMWKLSFTNITTPELGGTITAVLDGTEGQKMLDNMDINTTGKAFLQEDPGGQAYIAKMYQYDIASDALTAIAYHDSTRFISGAANFLTIDEEASGIIDMTSILGAGMYIFADQAHYSISGEAVEGGQLLAMKIGSVTTAISENKLFASNISLFPNPTKDEATVKLNLDKTEKVQVTIFDVQGKVVGSIIEKQLEKGEQTISLNTSNLSNGVYIVQLTAGGKSAKVEMIVTH